MKIGRMSHIGIAVESIEAQRPYVETVLGLAIAGIEEVRDQKVRVAFVPVGDTRVELIEPTTDDSPVRKFLDKNGPGVHHLAYEVEDVSKALEALKAKGVRLIDEKPRIGAGGVRIAFLHPKSTFGVLTEICEPHH